MILRGKPRGNSKIVAEYKLKVFAKRSSIRRKGNRNLVQTAL
jgi:hypothetical protein